MDVNLIKSKLTTNKLAQNILYYEQIESTNDLARQLQPQNGTLIIADAQTKGRGTHDRKWHTGKGENIAMTLIIYPNCQVDKLEGLTYKIATSVVKAIHQICKIKPDIKLPNDIILNKKKLGGILTESVSQNNNVKYLIIGIGLNINQDKFDMDLEQIATSLCIETKQLHQRELIIAEICNILSKEIFL